MPDVHLDTSVQDPDQKIRLQHLESLREDVRTEIKLRIQQRDTYSIQMTVALGTILGIATTATATRLDNGGTSVVSFAYRSLIAAPLLAIYYSILIFYSYRVHSLLARYMRDTLEPMMADLCHMDKGVEWENWYLKHAVPGIRKTFFMGSLWVTTILAPLYIGFIENWQGEFMLPLGIISLIYLLAAIWVTRHFWKG